MFRPTLNLATSPKPDEAVEAARARLEAERGMFIGNYMKNAEAARRSEAIASDFVDVDGPGRRGMRRVATSEVTIDPVAIEQEAKSAWKAELQTRLANIQSAKYAKIVSAVEAGARMADGETPESFAARKTALVQKLSRERGLPVTPAESDLIGPVSMLGEAGRSMARFAKMAAQTPGVIGQVAGEIVPMLGDPLSRMATAVGIPGMASRMGQAVNQAIDVAVPSEGIQPSMAVQREGAFPDRVSSVPRWLAARGPEAAGSLAATLIPGAAVGRAMGAGAGMATAMGVGTGLEVQGAFDDAMQGYLSQGVPEPVARQRAAGEAVVYGAISGVLEKFPAAEFLLKSQEGRRLLTRLGRGAFIEGSTEASQELAQALTQVAGGSAPDAMKDVGERVLASGVLGTLTGGPAGVLTGGVPRGTSQQTVPPPPPDQPAPPVQPEAEQVQSPPEEQAASPPPQIPPETVAAVVQAVQNGLIPADHPAALAVANQIQAAQPPAESSVVQPTTIEATPDVQDQEPSGRSEAVDVQQGGAVDLADGRGVGDLPVADAAPPDGGEDQRAGDLAPTADAGAAAQPAAAPAVVGVQQQPAPREAPPQVLKPSRGEYSKRSMIERIAADPFIEGAVQSEIDALDTEQLAQRAEGTSATTVQDIRFGKGVTQDVREGFSGATPQARVFQPDEQTLGDVFGGDVGKARESAEMMAAGQAGRRRRAVRIAGSGSVAGQPAMLAYQLRLIEREGPADAVQVVTNPVGLPDGTVVSISGVEHTVGRDAQGKKVLAGPGAVRLGLAGVERMYVDQGSIRMGGEQTISEPEVVDDLPISPSRRPRISDRASASAAKLGNRLRRGESFRVVEPATRGDRQAVAVAKRLGIEPVFFEGNVPYEGLVDPENPGVVFLESGQTVQNVRRLLTHEWAHTLKKNDPQAFNDLANRIEAAMPGELARSLERYRKRLRDAGMDDSRVAQGTDIGLEEAVAELLGDHADKAGFWSQLAGGEASVWQRIVDALRRLVTRVGLTSPVARELLRTVEAATAKVEAARGRSAAGVAKAAGKSSPMFSPAWHGSPHTFDKFSTQKIGTGEGAQAYGYGLYFAGKKEVAEYYRESLAGKSLELTYDDGTPIDLARLAYDPAVREAYAALKYWKGNFDTAISSVEGLDFKRGDVAESAAGKVLQRWMETGVKAKEKHHGRLYKVDLKPAEDEYLLWDQNYWGQSDKVKSALERVALSLDLPNSQATGKPAGYGGDLYLEIANRLGKKAGASLPEWMRDQQLKDDAAASAYLRSFGIRGIKYLDGSSRGSGDGSYNYVIFDDADVEIEMMLSPKPTRKDIDKAGRKAGKEDYGRPDLANVGTGEAARAEIDKYDEYAKRNEPSVLAVDMAKARRLAADPKSVLDAMRKSVASNSDAETVEEVHAAKFVVDALAAQAALSKSDADTAAAYDAHSLYRRQGTVSGRKLQARFDPVRSRDRRIISDLYRSMMEPAPKVLERLEKLEKTATDPNAAADDVRKAKAEIGKIREAEIERIKAVKEAIREAGLLDQLQRAENISKGSESAQVAAEAISVREREELNRKIAESDARLAEAEKSLLEAQGKILELKGESAEVRKLREDAQAQIDKNKAEAEKNKKEADRLRRQRADIAQREAALAQQIINWADGKGYNPADVVVIPGVEKPGGGGGGKGGGVSAPAFNPDAKRILAMPGQLDLGGSTESGALTVKGGPETPTFAGSGQEIVSQTGLQKNLPGLDATYEGGDVPAFVARTQTLIALPDGRLLTASEFYQVLKGVPDTAAWSDGPKGASGSQRIMPFEAIEEAKEIVKASKELDGWDAAIEFFRNSILSAPKTLIVNFTSTQLNAWYEVFAVRALKAAVNQIPELFGGQRIDPDGPTFSEFKAMYAAIGKSYARATLGFLKTFDTERPSFETEVRYASKLSKGESVSDISYLQPPAIKGTKGRVVRLPQRVMGASDEMTVAWVTTLDAAARAHRIARQEGLVGAAAGNRIADIMDDPSHPVWMESLNEAARVAFKSPAAELGGLVGPVAQALLKARVYIRKMPYVGGPLSLFLVMPHVPFVTTPANIMRAVANMTPLVAVRAGSRMFKAATGQQAYTGEMMLDDAARGIIVTGVMLATAALLADDEDGRPRLTGRSPSSQAERERWKRLGILPYSVRVGDTYVSYERYEPFSTALAATIDMVQAAGSAAGGDVGAAAQQLGTGGMAILTDKSYLTGVADLVKLALDVGQGRGSLGVQTYLANYFRPWVPNLMRSTMREFDPAVRETATLGPKGEHGFFGGLGRKTVYGLVPSLAQRDLEPKYDLWGREIRKASDAGPILGPVMRLSLPNDWAVSPNDDAAKLDLMIGLVNQKYRDTPEKQLNFVTPEDTLTVDGDRTPMTKTEYAFFLRESGRRALERLVDKGLDYENPGEREQKAVRREVREAREWARRQLVKERKENGAVRGSENAEQE